MQCPLDAQERTEGAVMAARARKGTSTVWPVASGYGMTHDNVFTMSTQGAR
jgi:phosphoribosylaminoimidazole carboxylase (NCAIR synthetase)